MECMSSLPNEDSSACWHFHDCFDSDLNILGVLALLVFAVR